MKLPLLSQTKPDENVGLRPLALLRADMRIRIAGSHLSVHDKQAALNELDYLVRYEQLRRLRTAVWQWKDERRERRYRMRSQREEFVIGAALNRQRARAEIAECRARIVHSRLDIIERVRKLAPREESRSMIAKARRDMLRHQLASQMARNSRRHLQEELADMIAARGRFLRRVRQEFPEMEDELMDKYDSQLFQRGVR